MKTEAQEKTGGRASNVTAGAARRGRRPGSEVSGRGALLAAAQKLFARSGFAGASLREVAREAGVAPALVCQLFGSKEGLYDALLDHLVQAQRVQLGRIDELTRLAEEDPRGALEGWVRMLVEIGPALSDVPALLMHEVDPGRGLGGNEDSGAARFSAVTEKLIHPFRTASTPLIRRALEAGVIRGSSPELVFSLLMGAAAATLLAPEIAGGMNASDADFRARTAEDLLALVLR